MQIDGSLISVETVKNNYVYNMNRNGAMLNITNKGTKIQKAQHNADLIPDLMSEFLTHDRQYRLSLIILCTKQIGRPHSSHIAIASEPHSWHCNIQLMSLITSISCLSSIFITYKITHGFISG